MPRIVSHKKFCYNRRKGGLSMKINVEKDEHYKIILRDCFTGGYTLPQYCLDNGIKKPLFVSEEKFLSFIWEIYVQFRYDKRMWAWFSFLDLPSDEIKFAVHNTLSPMKFVNFSKAKLARFDAIILLTTKEVNIPARIRRTAKIISFVELIKHFARKTYTEIPVLSFAQRHPGVKIFYTILPNKLSRYEGGTEFGESLIGIKKLQDRIKSSEGNIVPTQFDRFGYTNEDFMVLTNLGGKTVTNLDGVTIMADDDHPFVKIKDGKRLTVDQPEKFLNKIYFVGPCHFAGLFAPFDKTIESHLQKILNENNLPYRVENESQRCAFRYQDLFYNLNTLDPAPGDIIFLWLTDNFHSDKLPILDVSDAFDPPRDYKDFFCIKGHFNELGYKAIAEKIFQVLTKNNFYRDTKFDYPPPVNLFIIDTVYHCSSSRAA